MVTAQLDIEGLLATLGGASAGGARMPAGTDIGHVHLHVADLAATESFYCDALGMALTQRYGESALFFSAGGYHHHVGANVWAGVGAPPPPDDAVGLRYFTLRLPSKMALSELRAHLLDRGEVVEIRDEGVRILDPSNNAVLLTSEAPEWGASDHHEG
jgi:catechol 2,3-dioxygenase